VLQLDHAERLRWVGEIADQLEREGSGDDTGV
jgi:hypothetical protein